MAGMPAVPPRGKHEDETLACHQPLDVLGRPRAVLVDIVVGDALLTRQHGLEAFRIQVAVVHGVAGFDQRCHDGAMQRGDEAVLHRMGIEHEETHCPLSRASARS
jgi:hypothetical protein